MKIAAISVADLFEAMDGWPIEEKGLFPLLIMKMYARGGGLPDVDAENARMFGYRDVRTYRAAKAKLVARGVIEVVDGELRNARTMREIEAAATRREAAVENGKRGGRPRKVADAKPERSQVDLKPISDRSHMQQGVKSTICGNTSPSPSPTPLREEQHQQSESAAPREAVSASLRIDWKPVSAACLAAIGTAADPLAIGLMAVAEPLAWIAEGADLDLDVLPAIRKLAAQKAARGERIGSWAYFAKAVAANKASRLAGLPKVDRPKVYRPGRFGQRVAVEVAA